MSASAPVVPVLQATGIRKRLGRRAVLTGVDLALNPGRVMGLVGPNGAGKTTLMRVIAGLLRADEGSVALNGKTCASRLSLAERARQGLGYLPQGSSVFRRLSVAENLEAVPGASPTQCLEILRRVGLENVRDTPAGVLSGGERRRLEIGRLLLLRVHTLLCDEPFAGLDPSGVSSVARLLRQCASGGAAILATDHRVDVLFALCDEVAVLLDGRIAHLGSPEALRQDEALRQRYLGDDADGGASRERPEGWG